MVEAKLTFLRNEQGGRARPFPPGVLRTGLLRPHIVLGDINQRQAIIEVVNGIRELREEYLGVVLCDGPETVTFGEEISVKMALIYYPRVSYSGVVAGATFTVRDGPKVIGYGTITAKWMEPKPPFRDGQLVRD